MTICQGSTCKGGRAPCQSPMLCSGATPETESTIAASRLHRVPLPVTMEDEPTLREEWLDFVADLASAGRLLPTCVAIIVATVLVIYLIWAGVEKLAAHWPAAVVLLS